MTNFTEKLVATNIRFPGWMAEITKTYLLNITFGLGIREISRIKGCHPSTISRRIRKQENLRDDPLIDGFLDDLSEIIALSNIKTAINKGCQTMVSENNIPGDKLVEREARRILRRLCENNSFLVVSPKMDVAAVFKEVVSGRHNRIATVPMQVAKVFALKDWIAGEQKGSIGRYTITTSGKAALKRLLAKDQLEKSRDVSGIDEFRAQHMKFGEKKIANGHKKESFRVNLAESPLALLARKKDKSGEQFISSELLEAGERLREDFERAQMGPRVAQNWDRFLSGVSGSYQHGSQGSGSEASRERVANAMNALGPGLADIALRVCCFLEGLERAEKRLGWSARSGKVVLKIALQRLADHYGIAHEEVRKAG